MINKDILKKGIKTNSLKITNDTNSEENIDLKLIKPVNMSYYDWGFKRAKKMEGLPLNLIATLRLIREGDRQKVSNDSKKQEELKSSKQTELKIKEEELNFNNKQIEKIKNEDIKNLKEKIEKVKTDITEIKEKPEKFVGDKLNKVGFYIGLFILISLTISTS